MLALIKGKYASAYSAFLFICACDVARWATLDWLPRYVLMLQPYLAFPSEPKLSHSGLKRVFEKSRGVDATQPGWVCVAGVLARSPAAASFEQRQKSHRRRPLTLDAGSRAAKSISAKDLHSTLLRQ